MGIVLACLLGVRHSPTNAACSLIGEPPVIRQLLAAERASTSTRFALATRVPIDLPCAEGATDLESLVATNIVRLWREALILGVTTRPGGSSTCHASREAGRRYTLLAVWNENTTYDWNTARYVKALRSHSGFGHVETLWARLERRFGVRLPAPGRSHDHLVEAYRRRAFAATAECRPSGLSLTTLRH